jgi:hypothetical protein
MREKGFTFTFKPDTKGRDSTKQVGTCQKLLRELERISPSDLVKEFKNSRPRSEWVQMEFESQLREAEWW